MTASSIIRCSSCQRANRVTPVASGAPRCANCQAMLPWVVEASSASFDAEVTSSMPVIVDFWAPWCGPCRMVSPVLDKLANRHAGRLKVVKLNVDDNPQIAARFGAQSIPLLVLIRGGKEADRVVGALPESQLDGWLTPYLPPSATA